MRGLRDTLLELHRAAVDKWEKAEHERDELKDKLERARDCEVCTAVEDENTELKRRLEGAHAGLESLTKSAEAYMEYHGEKFYEGKAKPTGLWPAIKEARRCLTLRNTKKEE